jgi:RNA methyltransferase, TrmH family
MTVALASSANPRIKAAARLRDARHRLAERHMLIEGCRELTCALDAGLAVETVFVLAGNEPGAALAARCRKQGVEVLTCAAPAFQRVAMRENGACIVAIAPIPHRTLETLVLPHDPLCVVAESLEKPGNLGAILRTCDAAGVHAVYVADGRTDAYNPNVIRASLGAVFTVPVVACEGLALRAHLRARGIRTVALTPDAADRYTDADLTGPIALLAGAEAAGVSAPARQAADLCVRIPMRGAADSLNVATATAVVLFEALRQRHARADGAR